MLPLSRMIRAWKDAEQKVRHPVSRDDHQPPRGNDDDGMQGRGGLQASPVEG